MVVTGVEYAFLIGAVGATLECIKFCIEATEYIIDFTSRLSKQPQVIADLSAVLAVASMTLGDMSKKCRTLRCTSSQYRSLKLLIKLTGQTASHIEGILKGIKPKLGSHWFFRSSKALKAFYKDKAIKTHMNKLMQHLQLLSISVILRIPTTTEIADAVYQRTHRTVGVNVLGQIETLSNGTSTGSDPTVALLGAVRVEAAFDDRANEDDEGYEGASIAESILSLPSYLSLSSYVDDSYREPPEDLYQRGHRSLEAANAELRIGTSLLPTDRHQARVHFRQAKSLVEDGVTDTDASHRLRKLRMLTHVSLRMALCSTEAESYLDNAAAYNRRAADTALYTEARDGDMVQLDGAEIIVRQAQRARRNGLWPTTLYDGAFDEYSAVASRLDGICVNIDDYARRAAALAGCVRTQQAISAMTSLSDHRRRLARQHVAEYKTLLRQVMQSAKDVARDESPEDISILQNLDQEWRDVSHH